MRSLLETISGWTRIVQHAKEIWNWLAILHAEDVEHPDVQAAFEMVLTCEAALDSAKQRLTEACVKAALESPNQSGGSSQVERHT